MLTGREALDLLLAFPDVPPGWERLAVTRGYGTLADLDALLARRDGRDVLVLPGSDSWKDWVLNLMPGWTGGGHRRWRLGFLWGATTLASWLRWIERLHGREIRPRAVAGHSRGAAVGYVATHTVASLRDVEVLHLFGCPRVLRGDDVRLPETTAWHWAGTRDLVAQAPLTRLLGWRLPVTRTVDVPGARHALVSYADHLPARPRLAGVLAGINGEDV